MYIVLGLLKIVNKAKVTDCYSNSSKHVDDGKVDTSLPVLCWIYAIHISKLAGNRCKTATWYPTSLLTRAILKFKLLVYKVDNALICLRTSSTLYSS